MEVGRQTRYRKGVGDRSDEGPWYRDGLHFDCTRCGKCCTGRDGFVWLTLADMADLAVFLGLTLDDFIRKHVWLVDGEYVLKKQAKGGDCIFLKDKQCTVYGGRPQQCRTFPFWPRHLASRQAWNDAAQRCEGIREEAPLIPQDQVDRLLQS